MHRSPSRFAIVIAALLLAVLPGLKALAQAPGAELVPLKNASFDEAFRTLSANPAKPRRVEGKIGEGWSDNSDWADVEVVYGVDEREPHGGKSAQSVTISKVASGAVQMVQEVQMKKNAVYSFKAWLRGLPGTNVTMQLRKVSGPSTVYAARTVTLSAEWREFTVSGTAGDDAPGFLMFVAGGPTNFSVDDVRLEDLTKATTGAAPRVGNMFTGGSFEAGLSAGWSVGFSGDPKNRFADPRPALDTAAATDGKQSLRVDVPDGDSVTVYSPPILFNANRAHAFALDMKASEPNTGVRVELEGTEIGATPELSKEWQRVKFGGVLPYRPFVRLKIHYTLPTGGVRRSIWIDAAQLEEAEQQTPYKAPFANELTLRIEKPGSVVFAGEKEQVKVGVGGDLPAGARLKLSAVDAAGRPRDVAEVKLPAESFALPEFAIAPLGVFKLHGEIVNEAGVPLSAPVEMVWARLPSPRAIDQARSYFGIHIPLNPSFIAMAAATGHRWVRLHDSSMLGKWAIVEPEKGKFRFHDEGISAAHDAGLAVLGMLDGAPGWASAKPRKEGGYWSIWNIPDGTENWQNYVRTVVDHYRGRIDHWEVWNEPWGKWWTDAGGTPEGYGALLKSAYSTAKEANASATILGIDTYRGHAWTEKALAASGTDAFDGFSFHNYDDTSYGGADNRAARDARAYREAQAKVGPAKPLWLTEGGPGGIGSFYAEGEGGIPPAQQAAQAVRFDVTQMAAGVRAFFLYAVHADPPMGDSGYNAIEHDRAIKPILAARAVLASLVDGARCGGRREPVAGVDAYEFTHTGGEKVQVWWSSDAQTREVNVPAGMRAHDVYGNPVAGKKVKLGPEPIYLLPARSKWPNATAPSPKRK